ncbi:type II toxin-antitoxin system HicA family toxin [Candidatus Parcubacteria bacterium]|nr:MAG: type II toxin-antitoxin system HicA family toxin [Candidatus Parcubacteria bacterium]
MPRLHSSSHIISVLSKNGFTFVSQKGSHMKYRKKSGSKTLTVIVPANKREIPHGTFRSILRQSQLPSEAFS